MKKLGIICSHIGVRYLPTNSLVKCVKDAGNLSYDKIYKILGHTFFHDKAYVFVKNDNGNEVIANTWRFKVGDNDV